MSYAVEILYDFAQLWKESECMNFMCSFAGSLSFPLSFTLSFVHLLTPAQPISLYSNTITKPPTLHKAHHSTVLWIMIVSTIAFRIHPFFSFSPFFQPRPLATLAELLPFHCLLLLANLFALVWRLVFAASFSSRLLLEFKPSSSPFLRLILAKHTVHTKINSNRWLTTQLLDKINDSHIS